MPKKIGVVLAGCGVLDGSEIHEAVLTLLALDRHGVEAVICAPDVEQMDVVDHLTGQVEKGSRRNVLAESARIARGKISDVAKVSAEQLDGLILPGGFGAAKNLSDFAVKGKGCTVNPQVARLVREVHAQGKPVAAVCIAPAVLARVLGSEAPTLTIGNDPGTAAALEAMGAEHVDCPVRETVIDRQHKLITSPAYMLARRISEAADGIEKTVAALVEMA
jgi:enhancing lycopene biosynthesis protein 2